MGFVGVPASQAAILGVRSEFDFFRVVPYSLRPRFLHFLFVRSLFVSRRFLAALGDFSRLSHGFEVVGSTRKQLSAMTSQVPVMASERLARKAASPSARR